MRLVKAREKKGPSQGIIQKHEPQDAKSMGSQIQGKKVRRNTETGAVRPQSRLGKGKICSLLSCCRGNKPCTSYSRTNYYVKLRTNGYDIAYNFTHNNIMLEPNAMNNMNTVAHMDVHNTQY